MRDPWGSPKPYDAANGSDAIGLDAFLVSSCPLKYERKPAVNNRCRQESPMRPQPTAELTAGIVSFDKTVLRIFDSWLNLH